MFHQDVLGGFPAFFKRNFSSFCKGTSLGIWGRLSLKIGLPGTFETENPPGFGGTAPVVT